MEPSFSKISSLSPSDRPSFTMISFGIVILQECAREKLQEFLLGRKVSRLMERENLFTDFGLYVILQ